MLANMLARGAGARGRGARGAGRGTRSVALAFSGGPARSAEDAGSAVRA
jgi:hypothetical protein